MKNIKNQAIISPAVHRCRGALYFFAGETQLVIPRAVFATKLHLPKEADPQERRK